MNVLRDIKGPLYFPVNYLPLVFIAGILILAGLFFLLKFLSRRWKKKAGPRVQQKSAEQLALEALEALRAQNLPGHGRLKEFYFRLSDIARHYIEERFGIRAPEMTTEEFLSFLRGSDNLSAAHKSLLQDFLNLCDIVKFAKYGPTQEETDKSFQAAVRLVNETKRPAAEKEEIPAK